MRVALATLFLYYLKTTYFDREFSCRKKEEEVEMKNLTDEELLETYIKAKEMDLDLKFIQLLESELEKRSTERILRNLFNIDNQF